MAFPWKSPEHNLWSWPQQSSASPWLSAVLGLGRDEYSSLDLGVVIVADILPFFSLSLSLSSYIQTWLSML